MTNTWKKRIAVPQGWNTRVVIRGSDNNYIRCKKILFNVHNVMQIESLDTPWITGGMHHVKLNLSYNSPKGLVLETMKLSQKSIATGHSYFVFPDYKMILIALKEKRTIIQPRVLFATPKILFVHLEINKHHTGCNITRA